MKSDGIYTSDKEQEELAEQRKGWAIWWIETGADMDKNLPIWRALYCRKEVEK